MMSTIASVTSQGQLTIPAAYRKQLKLTNTRKILLHAQEGKLILEPLPSLLSFAGSLSSYAKKGVAIGDIMKKEQEDIRSAQAARSV